MVRKPDIQYIGQFYVYGSEAKQLEVKEKPRKAKTTLPMPKLEQIQKLYVDPVAIIGIAVAFVMLFAMVLGTIQIQNCWTEYEAMRDYRDKLVIQVADKESEYRAGYDLAQVEAAALAMGMVPKSELQVITIQVTIPEPVEEPNFFQEAWADFLWFVNGLFA